MSEQISTDNLVAAIIANLTFYEGDPSVEGSSIILLNSLNDWRMISDEEHTICVNKIEKYIEKMEEE